MTSEENVESLAIAELARDVGLRVLSPAARQAEADRAVPDTAWKALLETGLVAPVSEERGGGGIPDVGAQMIAVENLAYGDPGITMAGVWSGAAALLLSRHGREDQIDLASALMANLAARGSVALYEGYGRAPSEFTTTVSPAADGNVRVVGRKVGVAFGGIGDPLIVVGVDDGTAVLRAVLIPTNHTGVTFEGADGGLALGAAKTVTMTFDAMVPADNLIGHNGDSEASALAATIGRIRLALAAAQIGTAQRAIDYAAQYATERVAFGRAIAGFQGVSFPLAEAQIRVDQARLEVAEVAALLDADEATDHEDAVTEVVNHACEVGAEATRTGLQTLGGHGFITDHPSELWYRSAAALSTIDFDPMRTAFQPAI